MSDRRIATLKRADPAEMNEVQKRYDRVSTAIDDAVGRLQKIVDAGGEGLRGEYVEPLRKDAESLRDSLAKAAVRYHDVATEIDRYEPELAHAITEVAAATSDEADGTASVTRANALPDPQPGADGTIAPEEQQKAADKERAQQAATAQVTAAKNRLTGALDALDVAGKRFGDAVNCKKYDDGLSDSLKDKILAVFKEISRIFGIIAMILTVLVILIPGVNVLAIAALAASVVTLVADSVLLGHGEGSVLSVVLGAVGVGFGGLGLLAGPFAKLIKSISEGFKALTRSFPMIKIRPAFNSDGQLVQLVDLARPVGAGLPRPVGVGAGRPGFFDLGRSWWARISGSATFDNLQNLRNLGVFGGSFTTGMNGLKWVWAGWGGLNQAFAVAAGLIIAGLQATHHRSIEGT